MLNFHDVYDFLMILRKVYKKREKSEQFTLLALSDAE